MISKYVCTLFQKIACSQFSYLPSGKGSSPPIKNHITLWLISYRGFMPRALQLVLLRYVIFFDHSVYLVPLNINSSLSKAVDVEANKVQMTRSDSNILSILHIVRGGIVELERELMLLLLTPPPLPLSAVIFSLSLSTRPVCILTYMTILVVFYDFVCSSSSQKECIQIFKIVFRMIW